MSGLKLVAPELAAGEPAKDSPEFALAAEVAKLAARARAHGWRVCFAIDFGAVEAITFSVSRERVLPPGGDLP